MSYGFCHKCFSPIISRTRGIPSFDTCENGHYFNAGLTLTKIQVENKQKNNSSIDIEQINKMINNIYNDLDFIQTKLMKLGEFE